MEKPLAIAVRIYEGAGVFPYADIKTSLGSVETIVWTNINQREQFFYNGYTLFFDERACNKEQYFSKDESK